MYFETVLLPDSSLLIRTNAESNFSLEHEMSVIRSAVKEMTVLLISFMIWVLINLINNVNPVYEAFSTNIKLIINYKGLAS
jgi:hypothetical protein